MAKLKQELTKAFKSERLKSLVTYTSKTYRPFDPGQYLYNLLINFPKKLKFSEEHIELIYATLIAWNMNQRGAKLSEFKIFRDSIFQNIRRIKSLEKYRLETIESSDVLMESIEYLYDKLVLVAPNKPKLVTFSKTLHYCLPDLLMPIDRSYTLRFFYNNTNVPKTDDKQLDIYIELFEQFRVFASKHNLGKFTDNKWNRNIPKVIDNIVIAYERQNK